LLFGCRCYWQFRCWEAVVDRRSIQQPKNQAAAIAGFSPIFANFAALLTEHDNSKYIHSLQG